jgi:hypothetical protein
VKLHCPGADGGPGQFPEIRYLIDGDILLPIRKRMSPGILMPSRTTHCRIAPMKQETQQTRR